MAPHSTNDVDGPDSYPLDWPAGWIRTPAHKRQDARFKSGGSAVSLAEAIRRLKPELRRLGATNVVISTNVKPTLAGEFDARGSTRTVQDPGVAVYFRIKGQPRVLATDKWTRVADNIVAIANHIDAARGQGRWGVGTLEQAFAGYLALPAVGTRLTWWEILGFKERPTNLESVRAAWRERIERTHPDRPGNSHAAANQAAEINAAWTEAQRELQSETNEGE